MYRKITRWINHKIRCSVSVFGKHRHTSPWDTEWTHLRRRAADGRVEQAAQYGTDPGLGVSADLPPLERTSQTLP